MRCSVLSVLLYFAAILPGHTSSATPVEPSAEHIHSVTRWNGEYYVESDGVDISVVGLGNRLDTAAAASLASKRYHHQGGLFAAVTTTTPDADDGVFSTEYTPKEGEKEELTTWSIAWYLTLLSAFIVFFVFIGLMEVFCRRRGRLSHCCGPEQTSSRGRAIRRLESTSGPAPANGPPPPYDLFKPPSYNTLFPCAALPQKKQDVVIADTPPADELVYVVNVHGGRGVS